jgi:hypothetical protein
MVFGDSEMTVDKVIESLGIIDGWGRRQRTGEKIINVSILELNIINAACPNALLCKTACTA